MSWERRGQCGQFGPYYCRTHRLGRGFVREYVGSGPAAELRAAQDAQGRAEREARWARTRAEREAAGGVPKALAALSQAVDGLVGQALLKAGFHEHRGEWRRRRR